MASDTLPGHTAAKHGVARVGLARDLYARALAETAAQLNLERTGLKHAVGQGDCFECEFLRQHLAHHIALYLADVDPELRAVYRYDPTFAFGEEDRERSMPSESAAINLLAWTGKLTAALSGEISALQDGFNRARLDWICPKALEWCYALEVVVVDDAQVAARSGYAALIDSLWVRPTRVWSRVGESLV